MAITFAPRRGGILMCEFGPDPLDPHTFPLRDPPISVAPEVWKCRRVIVVSDDRLNHRHGAGPGLCTVVPCSATPPTTPGPWDVPFAARSYQSFTRDVRASCASLFRISHARLDRVIAGQGYRGEFLRPEDMARIEEGIRAALGL
jgi:uncharacterized protein YifN (PemK superfamily)